MEQPHYLLRKKAKIKKLQIMKQYRFFTMLMLCVAAMGFTMTSCLSDTDDDSNKVKPLTPADKAAMIAEMAGEYN